MIAGTHIVLFSLLMGLVVLLCKRKGLKIPCVYLNPLFMGIDNGVVTGGHCNHSNGGDIRRSIFKKLQFASKIAKNGKFYRKCIFFETPESPPNKRFEG